jgi:tRNA threonylcarbamoyladenosine biosynthesis protein TsaE
MQRYVFHADNLAATARLGEVLADSLPEYAVVALSGTLGAGKTQLVQAVAAAQGIDPRDVSSPTFVLVNEYSAQPPIYHLDAYRVRDDDEFLELGVEEYFDRPGWTFIEWADRVAACLPLERLDISIDALGETSRRFALTARGVSYETVLDEVKQRAESQKRKKRSG